ncbi:MAG TPA: tRNA (adenosine(37)-N6)-threonylcarbamoyltransferase complex dimerization subunit type 1 TsaB [Candidatus Elarobacter sp.]|jgi:tRNA threonylcarbamoyladenosine biosynthesis protein TsaB|nr:tRNA (adenosine(37)-N6)-threonylcarbamoyltransferase complex dimerization subunit type 1 TsaB [Candidatus Elarobacter sp.]
MKILALDAALHGFSAALDLDGTVTSTLTGRHDALEAGLAQVGALLERCGVQLTALDRIAVGIGPGSFTGLRIAVSYAKALAYGASLPLVGISSYDALEPPDPPLPLLAVVRGRRGVVCARLRHDGAATAACGPTSEVLDRLLTGSPRAIAVAGDTEDVLAPIAERGWTVRALSARSSVPAVAIAQLARTRAPSVSPHAVAPDYGEAPAVTRRDAP